MAIVPWVVRFVDKPDVGRVVRLDLNDEQKESSPEIVQLVTNPRAELPPSGWGGTATVTQDTTRAHSGTKSFMISGGASAFKVWFVAPGLTTYTLSGWVWIPASEAGNIRMRAGSTGFATNTDSAIITARDQWVRVSVTATTDADGGNVALYPGINLTGPMWADDLMITPGSTLYDYGDGDEPDWIWDGTPHASTSRKPAQVPGKTYVVPDGFSLGSAESEVATTGSMLVDGDTVTASRRINREVVIPFAVKGGSPEFAAVLNALSRELDRPTNYLEFKPSDHTGESLFFTVLPGSDLSEVALDPDDFPDEKAAQVSLPCEPVAVGLRQTGTATVNNNPAAATNPQAFTMPTIMGDLPTPLNVTASGTTLGASGATALLGAHAWPGVSARLVLQAEAATMAQTDTTVQANSAAMSGAGSNYARTTFATITALVDRVRWANLSTLLAFGSYRMLVRVRKTAAGDVFDVRRHLASPGGTDFYGTTVHYTATTAIGPHWLDLGVVDLPAGPTPPGVTTGVVGSLAVQAARLSGAGSLDIDAVVLIPDKSGIPGNPKPSIAVTWHQWASSLFALGFNAEDDEVWTATGTNYGHSPTRRAGSLPRVCPGYSNHVVFMRHVGLLPGGTSLATIPDDDLAWVTTIDWSYRPRWLYLSAPA